FLELVDGVARLQLNGSCDGCPSSAVTLKSAVEEALKSALPEVIRVEAVGEGEPGAKEHPGTGAFVPVSEIPFGRPGGAPTSSVHNAD
ncbi:MAG: NifU family protein, partial [Actinobacteria bacterium]|nr:NifU family protein [Actinomycetota bacterium]